MSRYIIKGGNPLFGKVDIHGAKNSVLPILAACVVTGKESIIIDCPDLSDVRESLEILKFLGCEAKLDGSVAVVNSEKLISNEVPEHLMLKMRSSVIFLGALIGRCKSGRVTLPGGCEIGPRPIDMHLKAFREMGIVVEECGGIISCNAENMKSAHVHLDFPSVGATENIMLAATGASGTTVISNAAREPEIEDLQEYLKKAGFDVKGAGSDTVYITGCKETKNVTHKVIPDRIETATYACAALMTRGKVELNNVCISHIGSFLSMLKESGADIVAGDNKLTLSCRRRLKAVRKVRTQPYPGFPTDMQSVFMSLMTLADGTAVIREDIFCDRLRHVDGLVRMGADIVTDGSVAVVRGVEKLNGAHLIANDLRGGAALTIAALAADGDSVVEKLCYIDRGYEKFEANLASLGAEIQRK